MKTDLATHIQNNETVAIIVGIVVLGIIGLGGYEYYHLTKEVASVKAELAATNTEFTGKIGELQNNLSIVQDKNTSMIDALQSQSDSIKSQVENVNGTVGTLRKLQDTDPELLQKYSKIYFLNENYVPSSLVDIAQQYLLEGASHMQIHGSVNPFLENLLSRAKSDGVDLRVASAYRSFGTQGSLKSTYNVTYGGGTANQFSADQGYSEHQLGTTVDFASPAEGPAFTNFDTTIAYSWLVGNANKYGFVLSYPKSNTYYVYEPWHWRFVGVALAEKLHQEQKNFYDLDQRQIDSYLAAIFD